MSENEQNARILHVLCPENCQNTGIIIIFAWKINKIPEFNMIFAWKMPDFFCRIIAGKIFFSRILGGICPSAPSPTPMVLETCFWRFKSNETDSKHPHMITDSHSTGWAKKVSPKCSTHNFAKYYGRFSKFFHCYNLQEICNAVDIKHSTTPQMCRIVTVKEFWKSANIWRSYV